ncbi:MAG: 30S ribosomal protein S13 [Candidatus Bathyarchaeia archaeon]
MSEEFRHILRIVDVDVDGTLKAAYALAKVKGISLNLANAMLRVGKIDPDKRAGFLTEAEIERIKDLVKDPTKHELPLWLFNRRKDAESGKDLHLTSADLVLRTKMDIEQMKNIKSWRGYRHAYGLKVRGQRTKTTGRAGKALGVKKKEIAAKQAAARSA